MWRKILEALIIALAFLGVFIIATDATAYFYQKSYALVIGINSYPSPRWPDLDYARTDAKAVAAFLKRQGFEVITLYDKRATKTAIVSKMQNYLARRVRRNDRVLIFFAGHGYTETLGGKDWGYIVPYHEGSKTSASYISMEELRAQSEKMGTAKHQLFLMDACYGGLLGTRGGGVDPNNPNYLQEVTRRIARQIITAGGRDQQVLDRGPGRHSVFAGSLLEALQEGLADTNGDGYITFAELAAYLVPAASNAYQTPAPGTLPGHGLGEFVFRSPRGATRPLGKTVEPTEIVPRGREETIAKHPIVSETARDGTFIAYASGVVRDTKTGLEWVAGPDRDTNFDEAKSWVESLNIDGGGWGMPTIEQLKTLYRKGKGKRNMTPLLKTTGWDIWSGEEKDSSSAWYLYLRYGNDPLGDRNYSRYRRAFAVRSRSDR